MKKGKKKKKKKQLKVWEIRGCDGKAGRECGGGGIDGNINGKITPPEKRKCQKTFVRGQND